MCRPLSQQNKDPTPKRSDRSSTWWPIQTSNMSHPAPKGRSFVNGIPSLIIMPGDDLVTAPLSSTAVVFNPVVGIVIKSPQDIPFIGINNLHTNQRLMVAVSRDYYRPFPNFGL